MIVEYFPLLSPKFKYASVFLHTLKTSPGIAPVLELALAPRKYIRPEYNY